MEHGLCAALMATLVVPSLAQGVGFNRLEVRPTGTRRYDFALVGPDLDGDGLPDIYALDDGAEEVVGISSQSGAELKSYPSAGNADRYFRVGDVDGDGRADFAISYGAVIQVVFSFLTGDSSFDPRIGAVWSVGNAGDINGDGRDDIFVVGSMGVKGFDVVYPQTPSVVQHYWEFTATATSASSFAIAIPDVNSDGVEDICVADGSFDCGATSGCGKIELYSGVDGTFIGSRNGAAGQNFGAGVQSIDDQDADGIPDLIVSAPGAGSGSGVTFQGRLYSISSRSLAVIHVFDVPTLTGAISGPIAVCGDLDGDEVDDVVALGSPVDYFYRSSDGHLIGAYRYGDPAFAEAYGDYDGDGLSEWFTRGGTPSQAVLAINSLAGLPTGSVLVGQGCTGGAPVPPAIRAFGGEPFVGSPTFSMRADDATPGGLAILACGFSVTNWGILPLPLAIHRPGYSGCYLNVSPDWVVSTWVTSKAGLSWAQVPLPIPPDPGVSGASAAFQWLVLGGPPGFIPDGMSPGLQVLIQ